MKTYTRILTLMLVLMLAVQVLSVNVLAFAPIDFSENIFEAGTGFTSADQVVYKKSGSYLYNWGARDEDATFLSTYAESFYTGSYTYDELSSLAGGTSESTAKNSALYKALSALMSSKQTYETSYNATRDKFQYTDCEMNGNKISSFYSGKSIGPAWDGGGTWNREHTWPNSKGDASGNGENDIMMLRPTATSENGSRGNKAYGEGSSYYNPNSESGGKHDLRGDVARIVLYTYVRWTCTNTGSKYNPNGITGTNGVIQSIDILLAWMEADPVDTWEMGRNDSVQSITGTRNVFVDYPEYAWLLFGEEIPTDMVTPSGEASDGNPVTPKPDPDPDPDPTPDPDPVPPQSAKEILDAAYSLSAGESLDGTYTLTGVITALDSYNNPTIVVGEYTDQPMYCYRLTDSRFVIGATITVTGNITNYGGLIEFKNCTLDSITLPSDTPKPDPDPDPDPTPDPDPDPKPEEPIDYVKEFKNAVSALQALSGEAKYNKILEALELYSKISSDDKVSISADYMILKNAINSYNKEAESLNGDSSRINAFVYSSLAVVLSVSAIGLCALCVFRKKHN